MRQGSGISKNKMKAAKVNSKGSVTTKKKAKLKTATVKTTSSSVTESIVSALSHSEAEDGLYFRNFCNLHEEDQRPSVKASKKDLLIALNQLLKQGRICVDFDELEITFRLV